MEIFLGKAQPLEDAGDFALQGIAAGLFKAVRGLGVSFHQGGQRIALGQRHLFFKGADLFLQGQDVALDLQKGFVDGMAVVYVLVLGQIAHGFSTRKDDLPLVGGQVAGDDL